MPELRPSFRELSAYVSLGQNLSGRWHSYANVGGSLAHGAWESSYRGQGMIFDSVRGYVAGDEVRHIDWAVTARTGKPHVKLFREERQRQVLLVVDDGPTMQFGTRRTFKNVQAARVAALLGGVALGDRERVGGVRFSIAGQASFLQWYVPRGARQPLYELLRDLSSPPGAANGSHFVHLGQVLDALAVARPLQSARSIVYILSDFSRIDPSQTAWEAPLTRLARQHQLVFVTVDDVADFTMPDAGTLELIAPDGKAARVATGRRKLGEVYRHWWRKRREYLEAIARQRGIPMMRFRTQDTAQQLRLTVSRSLSGG